MLRLYYYRNVQNPDFNESKMQLDLLLPVKPTQPRDELSFEIEGSEDKIGNPARYLIKNQ
jgi:hypothetical protein